MAKFIGPIGYSVPTETAPGVWSDVITEIEYTGDVLRETKEWRQSSERLNDDLRVGHRISIVSDDFAVSNYPAMKYVNWDGIYWKIANVEIQRPRLILSLGGVYNGPKNPTPD